MDRWKVNSVQLKCILSLINISTRYEYVTNENGQLELLIHHTNCLQCKTCAIKAPQHHIDWKPPKHGSGPNYIDMWSRIVYCWEQNKEKHEIWTNNKRNNSSKQNEKRKRRDGHRLKNTTLVLLANNTSLTRTQYSFFVEVASSNDLEHKKRILGIYLTNSILCHAFLVRNVKHGFMNVGIESISFLTVLNHE